MGNLTVLDDANFQEVISKGVTLVDFFAAWCGPCRMITPIVEQLADKMQGKVKVAKVDIDTAHQVTANYQITSVPTLILFKEGKEMKRVIGVKDLEFLLNLVLPHV